MLQSFFRYTGNAHPSEHRSIWIAKLFILLLLTLIPLMIGASYIFFGFDFTTVMLVALWVYHLILLLLFKGDYHKTARFLLSISLSGCLLYLSIYLKLAYDSVQNFEYYSIRIILLVLCILPLLLFPVRDKLLLHSSIAINIACLMLYDPVHEWFGAGYYQTGHSDDDYYFMNIIYFVAANLLLLSIFFLNKLNYKFERENRGLLKEKVRYLEELTSSSEHLKEANRIIEEQNEELNIKNEQLGYFVEKTSDDLVDANQQLRLRNEELEQFSYALSHNLRAPVASILGLANLIKTADEKILASIRERLVSSAENMDEILQGLSGILDINKTDDDVQPKTICVLKEVNDVVNALKNHLERINGSIDVSIDPEHQIKAPVGYINAIFYNLVHNSIKFHNPDNDLNISIAALPAGNNHIRIEVSDNGLGIDLIKHRTEIFRMSKRFHEHSQGNGLGLYLVKKMMDHLQGKIEVESKPNEGTTFTLYLPLNMIK